MLRRALVEADVLGKAHVLERLPEIYTRFILAVDRPESPGIALAVARRA